MDKNKTNVWRKTFQLGHNAQYLVITGHRDEQYVSSFQKFTKTKPQKTFVI